MLINRKPRRLALQHPHRLFRCPLVERPDAVGGIPGSVRGDDHLGVVKERIKGRRRLGGPHVEGQAA